MTRTSSALLAAAALALACTTHASIPFRPPTNDWWDCSFAHRRAITIDGSLASATLQDFPVAVVLDPARIDYAAVATSGADLRFVADGGTTALAHEIEEWNPQGDSAIWVKVPSLAAGTATKIWVYYGKPGGSDGQAAASVWDADYAGVWHLGAKAAARDSTGQKDGTLEGTPGFSAGAIGPAITFDGDDAVTAAPFPGTLDTFTTSAWIRTSQSLSNQPILFDLNGQNLYPRIRVLTSGKMNLQLLVAGVTDSYTGTRTLVDGSAYVLATTYLSPDNVSAFYVNGVLDTGHTFAPGAVGGGMNGVMQFGSDTNVSTHFLGEMDEVRVSRIVRSPEWLAAESRSMSRDAATIGAREEENCP
jgi:biopolymer transport protein ExbB